MTLRLLTQATRRGIDHPGISLYLNLYPQCGPLRLGVPVSVPGDRTLHDVSSTAPSLLFQDRILFRGVLDTTPRDPQTWWGGTGESGDGRGWTSRSVHPPRRAWGNRIHAESASRVFPGIQRPGTGYFKSSMTTHSSPLPSFCESFLRSKMSGGST